MCWTTLKNKLTLICVCIVLGALSVPQPSAGGVSSGAESEEATILLLDEHRLVTVDEWMSIVKERERRRANIMNQAASVTRPQSMQQKAESQVDFPKTEEVLPPISAAPSEVIPTEEKQPKQAGKASRSHRVRKKGKGNWFTRAIASVGGFFENVGRAIFSPGKKTEETMVAQNGNQQSTASSEPESAEPVVQIPPPPSGNRSFVSLDVGDPDDMEMDTGKNPKSKKGFFHNAGKSIARFFSSIGKWFESDRRPSALTYRTRDLEAEKRELARRRAPVAPEVVAPAPAPEPDPVKPVTGYRVIQRKMSYDYNGVARGVRTNGFVVTRTGTREAISPDRIRPHTAP